MDYSWKARQKSQRKGKQKKERTGSTDIPDVGRSKRELDARFQTGSWRYWTADGRLATKINGVNYFQPH